MVIPLKRGVFILSLDTELAWGSAHGGNFPQREELFWQTRSCISRLLKLLEKYQIHATWAVVGHLFLEQCQPVNGIKHPEIIRPEYSWFPDDWYLPDPCSSLKEAPLWYGRDIIEQIKNCTVAQEIGCHTFSHIRIGEPGCSRECFASELHACRAEAEKLGLTLKSFVFPRNSIDQLDVLAEAGFLTYRGVTPIWWERLPGIFSRICRRLSYYLPFSPPVVLPQREKGLWNLPASLFYPMSYKWQTKIPGQSRVNKVKRGLRQAVKKRRIFHLWFHPFNLATNPDSLLGDLETIFAEVCRHRDAGRLDNLTMGELAGPLSTDLPAPGATMETGPGAELTADARQKSNDPLRVRSFPVRAAVSLSRVISRPSLVKELGTKLINRKLIDSKHNRRLDEYSQYVVDFEEGVGEVAGVSPLKVKELLAEKDLEQAYLETRRLGVERGVPFLAKGGFVQLCYVLCRLLEPEVALETGVAYGWTSNFILTALRKNEKGHLYSIDLPGLALGSSKWSGAMVPDRLRADWSILLGPQAELLPLLLRELPPVDFFHYDSDKTYRGMLATFRLVWPKMSSRSVLVSDDLDNDAFLDFAEREGIRPIILIKPTDRKRVGILVHP